jgi:hypothetical protein
MHRLFLIIILLIISLPAYAIAALNGPLVKNLKVLNPDQCQLKGACRFSFQMTSETTAWSKKDILANAARKNRNGDALYLLTIDSGDDLYEASLAACLSEGPCRIKNDALLFKNDYRQPGWYGVQVTLTKNDPENTTRNWDRITHWTRLHIPVCLFKGTRSEGWYWADSVAQNRNESNIVYAQCADAAAPQCEAIGSKSEGWYADNWRPNEPSVSDRLIAWDICRQTAGYALIGEKCGPQIAKCYGENLACVEGVCAETDEAVCLTYQMSGSKSTVLYAVNLASYEAAQNKLSQLVDINGHPAYIEEKIFQGNCLEYAATIPYIRLWAPLCTDYPEIDTQYSNFNEFERALTTDAGENGERKGQFTSGECK